MMKAEFAIDLFLFFVIYLTDLLLWLIGRNGIKVNSGMICGVKLEKEEEKWNVVKLVEMRGKRQYAIILFLLFITGFIPFFIPYASIGLLYWLFWTFGGMALLTIPYVCGHKMLMEEKKKHKDKQETEMVYGELSVAMEEHHFSIGYYLPLIGIGIAEVILAFLYRNRSMANACLILAITSLALAVIFLLVGYGIYRMKIPVISSDSNVNVNYSRAKKKIWNDFVWRVGYLSVIPEAGIAVSFMKSGSQWYVIGTSILYVLFLTLLIIYTLNAVKKVEETYEDKKEKFLNDAEDDHWIMGIFYYNPNDSHVMVEKRFGTGTTMNMATKTGKGFLAFTILIFVSIFDLCAVLIGQEFTPMQLAITDHELTAVQLREYYSIEEKDMDDLELLKELPGNTKSCGTQLDHYAQGNFYVYEYEEHCEFFLNPQNTKFIRFKADGKTYIFSASSDDNTEEIYAQLVQDLDEINK